MCADEAGECMVWHVYFRMQGLTITSTQPRHVTSAQGMVMGYIITECGLTEEIGILLGCSVLDRRRCNDQHDEPTAVKRWRHLDLSFQGGMSHTVGPGPFFCIPSSKQLCTGWPTPTLAQPGNHPITL